MLVLFTVDQASLLTLSDKKCFFSIKATLNKQNYIAPYITAIPEWETRPATEQSHPLMHC